MADLKPDAQEAYRIGQQQMRFSLEWDRGTMNVCDLSINFASYAHFIASREWVIFAPVYNWLIPLFGESE